APPLRSAALQVDGDGFVFVVNPDSDSVTRLTPLSSGAQTKQWEMPVGDYPRTPTLMGTPVYRANQGHLYVTCEGTGELIVLAPDLTLITSVKLEWPTPRAVLVSGDDTRVYV